MTLIESASKSSVLVSCSPARWLDIDERELKVGLRGCDRLDVKRRLVSKKNAETASLYWVYIGLGLAHAVAGDSMDSDNAFMIAEKLCDRDLQSRGGSRHYQLWTNKALAILGQKQYDKAADAISLLTTIPSVSHAKGIYRQFAVDVGLLGTIDRSDEFRRVAGSIELVQ